MRLSSSGQRGFATFGVRQRERLYERLHRHRVRCLLGFSQSRGNRSPLHFFVSDHQGERNLLGLTLSDPESESLAPIVDFRTHPLRGERGGKPMGVRGMAIRDRQDHHLDRREPERKIPAGVLDVDPDEALEGAQDRPVEHRRLVELTVPANVLEPEAPGHRHVDLDRRQGPGPAEHVLEIGLDFRCVEGGIAISTPSTPSFS